MTLAPFTVITGASDGLGKAMAIECARRDMNLVLIALPGPELQHLADFLQKSFRISVLVIEQDLAQENAAEKIAEQIRLARIRINILINNAGIGNTQLFEEVSFPVFEKQIRLNILATTSLTYHLLPFLKNNGQAYILNVGSLACFFTLPRKQVYGGTKSFIYFFSRSLRLELKEQNISVTVLCPGGINSNPKQILINRSSTWIGQLSLMDPEEIAPLAIDGLLKKRAVIIPGRLNRIFVWLSRIIPEAVRNIVVKKQMSALRVKIG